MADLIKALDNKTKELRRGFASQATGKKTIVELWAEIVPLLAVYSTGDRLIDSNGDFLIDSNGDYLIDA